MSDIKGSSGLTDRERRLLPVALATMFLLFCFCCTTKAEEFEPVMICNAIFHAEGGAKAEYLYGIRSVHYADFKEARQICLNTVRNNRKRWLKAGKPGDFLSFLASKYCPVGASNDPKGLNKNWLKNVRYWLKKTE